MPEKKIVRADRSPMNPRKWCLELECGHEVWINAAHRPKRETSRCPECEAAEERKNRK